MQLNNLIRIQLLENLNQQLESLRVYFLFSLSLFLKFFLNQLDKGDQEVLQLGMLENKHVVLNQLDHLFVVNSVEFGLVFLSHGFQKKRKEF